MSSVVQPKTQKDKTLILEAALGEVRKKYNGVCADYTHLGTKIFTLLATELTVIALLFAGKAGFSLDVLYGKILFGIGIACIVLSVALLFWAITSNKWANPAEIKELTYLNFATYIDYLEEMKDDYLAAYAYCRIRFDKRRIAFDGSIMLFVAGVILLMVIKFGGKIS